MSEPLHKQELLTRILEAHAQLVDAADELNFLQLEEPSLPGGWSVKDTLVHVTWWEQRMIRMVQRALRGEPPQPLAQPGETMEQAVDRVNAETLAANRDRPVADILMERQRSFTNVLEMIDELGDTEAIDPAPIEAALGGELAQLIAANTYGHYPEHTQAILAWRMHASPNEPNAGDAS